MCRTTDFHAFARHDNNKLKIKAFLVQLWSCNSKATQSFPESLTLLYLPRINGHALEIEGTKIRPECPAFVTLHRVLGEAKMKKGNHGEALYASRERVKASEGSCFEIYVWEERVLKGVFRKDDDEQWRTECKCVMEDHRVEEDVKVVEVCVGVEGKVDVMREKVEMVVKKRIGKLVCELEDIPEERSEVYEDEDECCSCCRDSEDECCSYGDDVDVDVDVNESESVDRDMDGVGWAVDVGIWVMCLGVGYLVSKASARRLMK